MIDFGFVLVNTRIMSMSTGWKIGLGVGALALVTLLVSAFKPSSASTKQPPGGRPPSPSDKKIINTDENGNITLEPGDMGLLKTTPKSSVTVMVPNVSTDKLVTVTSSNPEVVEAATVAGEAISSLGVWKVGTAELTYTWTSGTSQLASKFTVESSSQ